MKRYLVAVVCLGLFASPALCAQSDAKPPLPVYLSELSNLNDYSLFANNGWDGNWYAGFNVCWMEELPPAPRGEYSRAYVGVKLGRMKTRPVAGKPSWEKEPIPGSVYAALSSTMAWKNTQSYFVVDTQDVPIEGDAENALEGTGEARWFWAEVPVSEVNVDGPNYVAVYSPTEYFVSTASSPILAGGWGSQKVNSWMNNDVRGYPPIQAETALKTAITVFEPAIAMKLVPKGTEREIAVTIDSVADGRARTANKTFAASVRGEEIERAWLEVQEPGGAWKKHGRFIWSPPFQFTLSTDALPEGKTKVRCAARDIWGNTGASAPAEVSVSRDAKTQ